MIEYPYGLPDADSPEQILDRMREIVASDRLIHDFYVDPDEQDPDRRNALCGGHFFCAIGSLWFAAGVPIEQDSIGQTRMAGVLFRDRNAVVAKRPHLTEARAAVNSVAQELIDSGRYRMRPSTYIANPSWNPDALELFFEGYYVDTDDVLAVIDKAKERLT